MRLLTHIVAIGAVLLAMSAGRAEERSYKRVDGQDISLSPDKFIDRNLEVIARAYYAGSGDWRFIVSPSPPSLVIFAKRLAGDARLITVMTEHCDAIKVAMTAASCRVGVHFRYDKKGIDGDILSGFAERIILRVDEVEIASVAMPRRR